jgi:hypothetical protein
VVFDCETLVDEALKQKVKKSKDTKELSESLDTKKKLKDEETVSRKERWIIMLKMPAYEELLRSLRMTCGDDHLEEVDQFGDAITRLHSMLNTTVHRELRDNVLDKSNTNGEHVVIDAESVGPLNAKLLKCIAECFGVPYNLYTRPYVT